MQLIKEKKLHKRNRGASPSDQSGTGSQDINGDGLADVVRKTDGGTFAVAYNTGYEYTVTRMG